MMVKGKVTRLMDFGAFVELEPGIEGLIHISELSPNRVRRVADIVKPEQEVEVRILKIEPEAKKISLSLRPLPDAAARAAEDEEEEDDDTPPAPKPERKVPLKGGLRRRRQAALLIECRTGAAAECPRDAIGGRAWSMARWARLADHGGGSGSVRSCRLSRSSGC